MSGKKTTRSSRKKRSKNPCKDCIPAKCCMYYSVEIDEPESTEDYDDMLWIIAHKDTEIYVNEGRWFVMVRNSCRFYDPEKGCLIYPKRPRICREHSIEDCEYFSDYDFDLHFHSYEELERYIRLNNLM
ncbi:YkgJ family cysteine cluster protein [bacterium]|nr:MAG: YkgJ family cysteine cluster protein [bacterium]